MVTGWSYRVGSSGFPTSCISCTSAFPREVTRSETCDIVPFPISCSGGSVVIEACQEPARVFSWSKDFCASDFWVSVFCTPDCAKATVESDSRTTDSIMRSDFMFHSPQKFISLLSGQGYSLAYSVCDQSALANP